VAIESGDVSIALHALQSPMSDLKAIHLELDGAKQD
jgi:hypothetical protein